ncbi:putative GTP-binding protein typA/BipA-like [Trypanosoma conorhini]|uniref:Putative GTP-binding protein typA/BipA-like n=1 Tax=Trypanosoma conorhini TaxID=83891 RepID=A0A3R7LDQ8_9TRYP|nr:putative GTP-binding protein typA/BipA-like [Trypanosoma conorhini]RNF12380.1 putative GTP-binding protein typA/BipA-like [Trypanosoma conorhini]
MAKFAKSADRGEAMEKSPENSLRRRRYYFYLDEEDAPSLEAGEASPPPQTKVKMANPGPLGLLGFGMTTVLLNLHNTGHYQLTTAVLAMGIFYGGIAQVVAGILEYFRGNTFAYVAFASYGSFWLSLVGVWLLPNKSRDAAQIPFATDPYFLGVYLLLWGIFTFVMLICTLRTNLGLITVFFTVTILFLMLAAGNMSGSSTTLKVAGYEGIFCGISALYLAFAEIVNETYGRELIPIIPIEKLFAKEKERSDSANAPV